MKLIYAGDPMCSWCYGFGKQLAPLVAAHPELPLDIVVGGLRAGATDVLDDEGKNFRLAHWLRVETASGVPFNRAAFLAWQGLVYDTEPVCRAVVAARRLVGAEPLLGIFRALQYAFYVEGRNTTEIPVLARVLESTLTDLGKPVTRQAILDSLHDPDTLAETQADFARARALGATSFPMLFLEHDANVHVVSPGFATTDQLEARLDAALAAAHAARTPLSLRVADAC